MKRLTGAELRRLYIEFFKQHGHTEIKSAPLVPENDPTVLFTTAGMHPLVPFLLGEKHPGGNRLVDCQKCVRTGDIDEVGNATHLTFFEMLGNWSLGDYFKEDAIAWSYEFLTGEHWLGIDRERLAVTVFEGDADAPRDKEAADIWARIGMPRERIFYLPKSDNWWGPAGQTGPCGPDTEMFFITDAPPKGPNSNPGNDSARFIEIWNDVFMQYNKDADGSYSPLRQKNVDTGMGLERTTAVLQGKSSNYDTELFTPIMEKVAQLARTDDIRMRRIITDHMRASTFMIADGVLPLNVDQGYVLRRLIRRAIRFGKRLGIDEMFTSKLADVVIGMFSDVYPELDTHREKIIHAMNEEEDKFEKTLPKGIKEFERIGSRLKSNGETTIDGKDAFELYATYGFPIEMTQDMAAENGLTVDMAGFDEAFKKHQELSRAGAEQKFSGGLADHSDQTTKLHTATHLLQAALRKVLGDHVYQKGSNITAERLRFDFSHPEKMTPEQKAEVERLVNDVIQKALDVKMEEMTVDEAKEAGAIGVFEAKYGEKVKVYSVDDFSKEICGGPHVKNTSELGSFKIKKEESSSAGVRRIKAVLK